MDGRPGRERCSFARAAPGRRIAHWRVCERPRRNYTGLMCFLLFVGYFLFYGVSELSDMFADAVVLAVGVNQWLGFGQVEASVIIHVGFVGMDGYDPGDEHIVASKFHDLLYFTLDTYRALFDHGSIG